MSKSGLVQAAVENKFPQIGPRSNMRRDPALDLIRLVAVLFVLGRHMTVCPPETSSLLHDITHVWWVGGWVGVDIFFVLSGFLVSGLLFREWKKNGHADSGRFLIRRGFKIYPAFWVLIAMTICLQPVIYRLQCPAIGIATELTFTQNYAAGIWNHTWSLAVEEHFYILLTIYIFWLVKHRAVDPFRHIPFAFLVTAILCQTLRALTFFAWPQYLHLGYTHLRLDSLFFGVFLSWCWEFGSLKTFVGNRIVRLLSLPAGVALLSPAFMFDLRIYPAVIAFGVTLFYLGGGLILIFMLGFQGPFSYPVRALSTLGSFSYSIYIWHMPVHNWLCLPFGQRYGWVPYILAYLAGALIFGVFMSILIEQPALILRNRLFPSRNLER